MLSSILLSLSFSAPPQEGPPVGSLVSIDPAVNPGLSQADLLRNDLDVVYREPRTGTLQVLCEEADLRLLDDREIVYTIVHEDLAAYYASRLDSTPTESAGGFGAWLSPPFGQGSMGGYYTWNEVLSVLDQMAAAYPDLIGAKFSIGQSVEGRDLWVAKISDNHAVDESEPEVRFDAMHHAREPQSMQTTLWMMLALLEGYGSDPVATWLVDNREMFFVPVVNPDGYVYNETTNPAGGGLWRKNRRNNGGGSFGVDLNRNYPFQWGVDDLGSSPSSISETYRGPSAGSEPEVQAMTAFMAARAFVTAISCHSFSDVWLYPWGYIESGPPNDPQYQELSALQTVINGYPFGSASILLYLANGVTIDHDQGMYGTLSWTPEVGDSNDGFWPPSTRIVPLADKNLEGFLRTAFAAGAYVHVSGTTTMEVGDGDGFFEAGELVEVTVNLRNSGQTATAGTVDLALSTSSAEATVVQSAVSVASVGSFADGDNLSTPLSLLIDSDAAAGTAIPFDVTVSWEGYTEVLSDTVLLGEPVLFLADSVEVDLGWQAGAASDTATTGIWEFGDPVGTTSNGEDSNPEDDATADPGVNCFATGNGSTNAGGDDVDDGLTTLITPTIDLSSVNEAIVSYERWYANLGSPADDTFEVSISNDDGATWVSLESVVQNANEWTKSSFLVSDFVTPTDQVRLRFVAEDDPNNSLVEAGIDELQIEIYEDSPRLNLYGSTEINTPLAFHLTGPDGAPWIIYSSLGTADISLPLILEGSILIDPATAAQFLTGSIPSGGLAQTVFDIPNDTNLLGLTLYFQALVLDGGVKLTNRDEATFE